MAKTWQIVVMRDLWGTHRKYRTPDGPGWDGTLQWILSEWLRLGLNVVGFEDDRYDILEGDITDGKLKGRKVRVRLGRDLDGYIVNDIEIV